MRPTITDSEMTELIIKAFANCFGCEHDTQLLGGASEPLYMPASAVCPAVLFFREDYPASALHEVAHWCIAGASRLELEDFGYGYIPGPRSAQQQADFFDLELRAQCLESVFALALGIEFQPSADNFSANTDEFSWALEAHKPTLQEWLSTPPGRRAQHFIEALHQVKSALATEQTAGDSISNDPGRVR